MLLKKLKHKLKINSLRIKNHFYLEVVFLCLYLSFKSKSRFWSNDKFINLHNRVSHKINIPRSWSRIKIKISPMRKLNSISRSEEHTSELQSRPHLVCRLLLEKKKNNTK